ncbi:MAG: desulfoferrodoxin FeS4 iron-binding domain-containing protein [Oscillospiraceae bacterium]|nr:desulfoferrodoxin FeS4 iron-binding domain-containing protein [Oscillospiraceae bacterium]
MEMKFYVCERCGNLVTLLRDKRGNLVCCGQDMKELIPGTSDGAHEKHVPVWSVENGVVTVQVGSVEHPMLDAHYIEWIALQTRQGCQLCKLQPGQAPKATFALAEGDEVEAVYEYCNLHGLWKA